MCNPKNILLHLLLASSWPSGRSSERLLITTRSTASMCSVRDQAQSWLAALRSIDFVFCTWFWTPEEHTRCLLGGCSNGC